MPPNRHSTHSVTCASRASCTDLADTSAAVTAGGRKARMPCRMPSAMALRPAAHAEEDSTKVATGDSWMGVKPAAGAGSGAGGGLIEGSRPRVVVEVGDAVADGPADGEMGAGGKRYTVSALTRAPPAGTMGRRSNRAPSIANIKPAMAEGKAEGAALKRRSGR
jgi:hypothetical protein